MCMCNAVRETGRNALARLARRALGLRRRAAGASTRLGMSGLMQARERSRPSPIQRTTPHRIITQASRSEMPSMLRLRRAVQRSDYRAHPFRVRVQQRAANHGHWWEPEGTQGTRFGSTTVGTLTDGSGVPPCTRSRSSRSVPARMSCCPVCCPLAVASGASGAQTRMDADGPCWDRTSDLGIKSPLLYQLS